MKTTTRTKESTNLPLNLPPHGITTLMGDDFDPSGYARKVEILNEGSGDISTPLVQKNGNQVCRKVVS